MYGEKHEMPRNTYLTLMEVVYKFTWISSLTKSKNQTTTPFKQTWSFEAILINWKSRSQSHSEAFPSLLCTAKYHFCVHARPPMDPILSQLNPDRLATVHNGMTSRLTAVEAKFTCLHLTLIIGMGSVNYENQSGSEVVVQNLPQIIRTCLLPPWSRILLEKLTGFQLVMKFRTFYGTRRFITAITSARHLSLS
jgi:hypothetical protein